MTNIIRSHAVEIGLACLGLGLLVALAEMRADAPPPATPPPPITVTGKSMDEVLAVLGLQYVEVEVHNATQ